MTYSNTWSAWSFNYSWTHWNKTTEVALQHKFQLGPGSVQNLVQSWVDHVPSKFLLPLAVREWACAALGKKFYFYVSPKITHQIIVTCHQTELSTFVVSPPTWLPTVNVTYQITPSKTAISKQRLFLIWLVHWWECSEVRVNARFQCYKRPSLMFNSYVLCDSHLDLNGGH